MKEREENKDTKRYYVITLHKLQKIKISLKTVYLVLKQYVADYDDIIQTKKTKYGESWTHTNNAALI